MLDTNRHVITALHAHNDFIDGGINGPTAEEVTEVVHKFLNKLNTGEYVLKESAAKIKAIQY